LVELAARGRIETGFRYALARYSISEGIHPVINT
jgi:hypothetical protein